MHFCTTYKSLPWLRCKSAAKEHSSHLSHNNKQNTDIEQKNWKPCWVRFPGSEKLGASRNGRMERNFPVIPIFRNFRPTSRGTPKISEWNSGKCLFHSLPNPEFPEFLVEWKAPLVSPLFVFVIWNKKTSIEGATAVADWEDNAWSLGDRRRVFSARNDSKELVYYFWNPLLCLLSYNFHELFFSNVLWYLKSSYEYLTCVKSGWSERSVIWGISWLGAVGGGRGYGLLNERANYRLFL